MQLVEARKARLMSQNHIQRGQRPLKACKHLEQSYRACHTQIQQHRFAERLAKVSNIEVDLESPEELIWLSNFGATNEFMSTLFAPNFSSIEQLAEKFTLKRSILG